MLKNKQHWESIFPEFIECGGSAINSLMESSTLAEIAMGQQVFSYGAQCDNYLLLLKGSVKVQLLSENGREMLLYQVFPGGSCVLTTSCLLSGDCYPAEAFTEQDVTAFVIPAHAFYRCMEQSAFFREFVFKNFATRLSHVIARINDVVFSKIDWRLAQELLKVEGGTLKITHQQLATQLGSVREVISRHLKRFEANGWISLNRGAISINDSTALKNMTKNSVV